MHYTYVWYSESDREWYTGATSDLKARVREHAEGRVRSTATRRPLALAYYEACLNREDAFRRERYLKTRRGKRYLKQRLGQWRVSLAEKSWNGTRQSEQFALPFCMSKSCSLSAVERQKLQQWIAAHGTPQQVAMRCRIVLAAAALPPDFGADPARLHQPQIQNGKT